MAKLPIRSEHHEIGDAAVREFNYRIPKRWVTNVAYSDYGWDGIVSIAAAGSREVREEFYVQVKGSRSVKYIAGGSFASLSLKCSTINFLSQRLMPVMIVLCDEERADLPIYWVWLPLALDEIGSRKVNWRDQDTVTLRIPTSQLLSHDIDQIESDVRSQSSECRVATTMLDMFLPHDKRPSVMPTDPSCIDETYIRTKILPTISITGAVLDSLGGVGPDSRRDRLQRVSALLRENKDSSAEGILTELGKDISESPAQIQASYYNCKGILALHRLQLKEAHEDFCRAVELNPSEPKYATNTLIAEYSTTGYDGLPTDWRDRLARVIAEYPDFVPAVRTRTLVLARDGGLDCADNFVRSSPAFGTEPRALLIALAEASEERGEVERALKLIAEAENLGASDAEILSLKAVVLLRKALSFTSDSRDGFHLDGYGPSELDIDTLAQSADTFDRACLALNEIGPPLWGEATFTNAAVAFMMAQRFIDGRRHCESFLKRYPDSCPVAAAFTMILFHSDEAATAIPYASTVYDRTKDSGSFKNLLLVLQKAEEYEKVLERIRERQDLGFKDQDEQALALHLAAVAFAELGQQENAKKCIDQIRQTLGRPADAAAADIFLAKRIGLERSVITKMTREAHEAYPDHPVIGALFVLALTPVTAENAEEVIRHISSLALKRQLALEEVAVLGEAYFILRRYAEAEITFRSAAKRFPNEPEFIAHQAYALHEQGRDEEAFSVLSALLSRGKHSFAVYSNLGHLARITGRLDDAIKLFELALGRTTSTSDRAQLHCLLYELHKRRGDSVKELLWHAVQFGKVCGADPESEARYLIMFFIATLPLDHTDDSELKTWISEFQERLKKFSNTYPRFHSLMTLRAPEGLSERDAAYYLFTEVASLMLPTNLVRCSIAIRMREGSWPLATRAELLGASSVCEYWQNCTKSSDPEHAIYIFSSPLDFVAEVQSVPLRSAVCVDLTTLLTLKLLNLLDEAIGVFEYWIIAAGTREAVEDDSMVIGAPQGIASELRNWLIQNRSRIRTRQLGGRRKQQRGHEGYHPQSGIWIRNEIMMYDLVGKGVGETLLLAKQLDLPLYSDETAIRLWCAQEYGVRSFSTISLLRRLRNESRLSLVNETACIVKLIASNYRYVPFGHEHLQQALEELLRNNSTPNATDMANHELLGILLKEIGEMRLDDLSLLKVAAEWWLDFAAKEWISEETCAQVAITLCFRLSQRVKDSVLIQITPEKLLRRRALIWAMWLATTQMANKSLLSRCWATIRRAEEILTRGDEKTYNQILQSYVPERFYHLLKGTSRERLVRALVEVPEALPEPERHVWQQSLLRLAKRDRLVQ